MKTNYSRIAEQNILDYGRKVNNFGPLLFTKLYSERTHFIYELLQNAEDAGAKQIKFELFKDKLEVTHDGRPFDERDVAGICGIGESTKKSEVNQIGKFGIGFKAVYNYTRTPEVHSNGEAFVIENYVCPRELAFNRSGGGTLFVFPFNHPEMPSEKAFTEIGGKLAILELRTILFLRSIEKISWNIENGGNGEFVRSENKNKDFAERVIRKNGTVEEWLVFDAPAEGSEKLRIELAFRIKKGDDKKGGGITFIPVNDSKLCVYFPTEKDTRLKFLLQGPYRTTPARDNIPNDDAFNISLTRSASNLLVKAVGMIKSMGLISPGFLELLPIQKDDFPEYSMFKDFYKAVLEMFKAGEKLLPAKNGQLIEASAAAIARGQELAGLLDASLAAEKILGGSYCWLDAEITENKRPVLKNYLEKELGVREITFEKFAAALGPEFLAAQSDEWLVKFYNMLLSQRALWDTAVGSFASLNAASQLRYKTIIRLDDGSMTAPFVRNSSNASSAPLVYLQGGSKNFKYVKKSFVEDPGALQFFKALGLGAPNIADEVEKIILPKYEGEKICVNSEENLEDLASFIKVLNLPYLNESVRKRILACKCILVTSFDGKKKGWFIPRLTYLPFRMTGNNSIETYFEGNPDAYLADDYLHKRFTVNELEKLGFKSAIMTIKSEPGYDGNVVISNSYRNYKRGISNFDPNFQIEGLEFALANINTDRAAIIWKILKSNYNCIFGIVETSTNQRYGNSGYNWAFSKAGEMLKTRSWVPDTNNKFKSPSELKAFEINAALETQSPEARFVVEKLKFRNDEIEEAYKILAKENEKKASMIKSIMALQEDEIAALLNEHSRIQAKKTAAGAAHEDEKAVSVEIINFGKELASIFNKKISGKNEEDCETGSGEIADPDFRRGNVRREIKDSISGEQSRGERFKKVPAARWEAKNNEVRSFLEAEYGGKCQICGGTFKKASGGNYFEGLYLVSRTKNAWLDRPGNVLCLCPNCCAKFQHGEIEIENDLAVQLCAIVVTGFEDGPEHSITVKICGREETIRYTARHLMDIQEMIAAGIEVATVGNIEKTAE